MKAVIKHILIEVNQIKIGYTVRIAGLFGIVTEINNDKGTATISFTDGSIDNGVLIAELKYSVVKFLAVMKDLNSFPVIHSDFTNLINYFDTKDKVKELSGNKEFTVEGSLLNILTYPKDGDIVELTSLKIAEKFNFLGDRTQRIGIIEKKANDKSKFIINFPTKKLALRRGEFDILNGLNNKQVFKINE